MKEHKEVLFVWCVVIMLAIIFVFIPCVVKQFIVHTRKMEYIDCLKISTTDKNRNDCLKMLNYEG